MGVENPGFPRGALGVTKTGVRVTGYLVVLGSTGYWYQVLVQVEGPFKHSRALGF